MTEKKDLIIQKAAELFAKNGYDATSIQQITDACGISKGSFYLSFKSKESLLAGIITSFTEKIVSRADGVFMPGSSAEERFERSLAIYFQELDHYSAFILTLIREQANPMNESMRGMLEVLRKKMYTTQERLLIDLYGENYRDRMPDLVTMLNGIMKGYIELIIFNNGQLDHRQLPAFIRKAMDALAAAMDKPYLSKHELIEFHCKDAHGRDTSADPVRLLEAVLGDSRATEEETVSAQMILEELRSAAPRRAVIAGMSTNLKGSRSARAAAEAVGEWLSR